jgi:MFS family permease
MSVAGIAPEGLAESDGAYPAAARAWQAMAILCLAAFMLQLDRGILYLVVDPIRRDLDVSEVQIGLLQGLSFAVLYAFASLPLGYAADRVSRRNLAAAGLCVWTFATLVGGFSRSYDQLFASRILVGLGEATLAPCALSLICDFFPPDRRGRAVGLFVAAQCVAPGLSLIVSGGILGAAESGQLYALGLPRLAPWRMIFIVSGVFGFVAAALFFTMREPARRGPRPTAGAGIRAAARFFLGDGRRFLVVAVAFSIDIAASAGANTWSPTFLLRRFNIKPSDLGAALGTVTLLIGVLTPLLSGFVIDRIARARIAGGNLLLLSGAALLEGLAAFAAFAPSPVAAVCFLSLIAVCAPLITTTVYATCQQLVPGAMRGLGMALIALFGSIIGGAGGPFMISWVTETVFRDDGMVGVSISVVIVPCVTIAAAMFFATWRRARRESARGAS